MPKYSPTEEQAKIVSAAERIYAGKQPARKLIIEAGAGTGKTSTFVFASEALPQANILCLTFSKALQVEASGKFPGNVTAKTAHSLAFGWVMSAYRKAGVARGFQHRQGKFVKGRDLAKMLHCAPFGYTDSEGEQHTVEAAQIGTAVRETINNFCKSADREVSGFHVPFGVVAKEAQRSFEVHVLSYAQRAWTDIADPKGSLPFMPARGDGCYLKLWSLDDPQLPYDMILFDEAQDAAPAIAHVVGIQRKAHVLLVGDRAQAIMGFTGAVDAMQQFAEEADEHLFLSQSFRFGQAIAEAANPILNYIGTPLKLRGLDSIESALEDVELPDAVLCRTNAGVIMAALDYQQQGKRVAIVGGTKDIEGFIDAADLLLDGRGRDVDYPALIGYRDWSEVQSAVANGEADIGMLVRLVDTYGTSTIREVCRNSVSPAKADMLVSTAHKSKGLEWDQVKIGNDFTPPKTGQLATAEAMLLYVAVTRARTVLDKRALHWLDEALLTTIEGEAA